MGGPCKTLGPHAAPDSAVAKYAKKHSPHPRLGQLAGRVVAYENCLKTSKTAIHKPGSQNRKK